jgi:hypothetical protein
MGPEERRTRRADLLSLAGTCRAVRSAVRPLLFRSARLSSVEKAQEIAQADWAVYVT